jgi:chitinase
MHGTTTLLTGLLAASAVVASPATARKHKRSVSGAGNQVVAYWGNTGYSVNGDEGNIPIETICSNDDVDKVIISFLTEFPDQRPANSDKLPVLNLANSCGMTFKDRDGPSGSNLLWCPMLEDGLRICQQKGKELLLSLGGAWPGHNGFATVESAESLATWIYQHFGPKVASVTERPFGDIVLDGIDLDIESLDPVYGQQYYRDFGRKLKSLSNNNWAIGAAPQCIAPDANLGTYIQEDFIDYIFVQLYNTQDCSARKQLDERSASTNTWESKWLTGNYAPLNFYANNNKQIFAGLVSTSRAMSSKNNRY